ncbi:MAG TPA: ATP-binding protein [Caulobacteraceae bacterium]
MADAAPTLFVICGLPGSGKTMLARRLEAEHDALRLTPDEWMSRIVGDGWDHKRREAVEAVMTELAVRALQLGCSVVLDFGCWRRVERDQLRDLARSVGARPQTHYCTAPLEELQRRLSERNRSLPEHTFVVTPEQVAEMYPHFEVQAPDETDA